jgi:hypothetical protein
MSNVTTEAVAGLILCENKAVVRNDLINQFKDFAPAIGPHRCLTLPGTNFVFESTLLSSLRYWQGKTPDCKIDCFEIDQERFDMANRKVPHGCSLQHKNCTDGLAGKYDLLWLDLCCTILSVLPWISKFVKKLRIAQDGKPCLFYMTVCMSRIDYHKLGWQLGHPGCKPRRIVEREIEKRFKLRSVPFSKVYSVYYAGGQRGTTGMLTIGYVLNPTAATPLPKLIQEDRTSQGADYRRHRYATADEKLAMTIARRKLQQKKPEPAVVKALVGALLRVYSEKVVNSRGQGYARGTRLEKQELAQIIGKLAPYWHQLNGKSKDKLSNCMALPRPRMAAMIASRKTIDKAYNRNGIKEASFFIKAEAKRRREMRRAQQQ